MEGDSSLYSFHGALFDCGLASLFDSKKKLSWLCGCSSWILGVKLRALGSGMGSLWPEPQESLSLAADGMRHRASGPAARVGEHDYDEPPNAQPATGNCPVRHWQEAVGVTFAQDSAVARREAPHIRTAAQLISEMHRQQQQHAEQIQPHDRVFLVASGYKYGRNKSEGFRCTPSSSSLLVVSEPGEMVAPASWLPRLAHVTLALSISVSVRSAAAAVRLCQIRFKQWLNWARLSSLAGVDALTAPREFQAARAPSLAQSPTGHAEFVSLEIGMLFRPLLLWWPARFTSSNAAFHHFHFHLRCLASQPATSSSQRAVGKYKTFIYVMRL